MSQNLGSLPPLSHNVIPLRPPLPPLTCVIIYGCPLTSHKWKFNISSLIENTNIVQLDDGKDQQGASVNTTWNNGGQ